MTQSVPTSPAPEPIVEVAPAEPIAVAAASVFEVAPTEAGPTTDEMSAFTGEESEPPASVEISIASSISVTDASGAEIEHVTEEAAVIPTSARGFSLSALMSSSEAATPETDAPPPSVFDSTIEPPAAVLESSAPSIITEPTPKPVDVTPTETAPSGLSGLFGSSEVSAVAEELFAVETSKDVPADSVSANASLHEDHTAMLASGSAAPSPPTASKPIDKDRILVSKSALLILVSYATAITFGFLYQLYYGTSNSKDYGLESLPDPVPRKGKTTGIYQETTPMPDGHELKIGETQQFGKIKVMALRVTREPIKFRHFSGGGKARLPTAPVLKLWLRFTNVSEDQEIAPLDDRLLFHRIGRDRFSYHSNQFVVRADQKENREALRVIAYDHTTGSGWDLADLPLDKPLRPGESRDYYVPTCENDLDKLTGELLWRVHIRKGYSARGNGVTTLFEVHFHSNAIRDEQA